MLAFYKIFRATICSLILFALALAACAQSANSGSVIGVVVDPSGAVVTNATVEIHNPISGFSRTTSTDSAGKFSIPNIPFNPYHLTVTGQSFAPSAQDVNIQSNVAVNLSITLAVRGSNDSVTVEADSEDLLEKTSTFHTDVDRGLFDKLPLESQSSSLSSLVTLASPGITADSNGLFHGLGDHAENSFSVDGQPITDQQSKVFSNQIPLDVVESLEVISGAPPAEFGEKTSVVINVTTRSGQGVTTPHGAITASYGSFGTANLGFNLAYGHEKWGNFISANGLNGGRFLDPPQFAVFHAKGNEENFFDRVDYQLSGNDSLHLNLGYTRSWFQNPNAFDNVNVKDQFGNSVGSTDQRSQIKTFNVAPSWTRVLSPTAVFTLGAFVRRDQYNYYPSKNPLADLSPIQQETVAQDRTLANAGLRSDVSYVKGIHNVKVGATYQQTFLTEKDTLGIVDPRLNAPCLDTSGNPIAGFSNPSTDCIAPNQPNVAFLPILGCYDLTRPAPATSDGCSGSNSGLFSFHGHTDVKQLALFAQDTITKGAWSFNLGIRGDLYNGLTTHREVQPRLGVAYNFKPSNTVLRVSYARVLETPFNENLVISSIGCGDAALNPLLGCTGQTATPFSAGWRNEFHAGVQQAFGKYAVFSGEYIWKYTHNAYDFSVLGNTPIFFPIAWHNSKIPGFAGRVSVPNVHGFSALMVFSSVAARFFTPQLGGAGAAPSAPGGVFRIDHDEKFNQTTHMQYQPWKNGPWVGGNWRYDSGLVAGRVPFATSSDPNNPNFAVNLSGLSADQQFQAGLTCNGVAATPTAALPASCPGSQFGSTLVKIPAPGTQNADRNPARIQARNLFDLAVGDDNLFHGERYKMSLQVTAINLMNKKALYNFLSTFSGTHYVTPRALTAELAFHF